MDLQVSEVERELILMLRRLPKRRVMEAMSFLESLSHQEGSEQEIRKDFSLLSDDALRRVWDNAEDAVYDNWRQIYGTCQR